MTETGLRTSWDASQLKSWWLCFRAGHPGAGKALSPAGETWTKCLAPSSCQCPGSNQQPRGLCPLPQGRSTPGCLQQDKPTRPPHCRTWWLDSAQIALGPGLEENAASASPSHLCPPPLRHLFPDRPLDPAPPPILLQASCHEKWPRYKAGRPVEANTPLLLGLPSQGIPGIRDLLLSRATAAGT